MLLRQLGGGLAHPKSPPYRDNMAGLPNDIHYQESLETLNSEVDGLLAAALGPDCEEVNGACRYLVLCLVLRLSCCTCGLRNIGLLSLIQHRRSVLSSHVGAISREIQGRAKPCSCKRCYCEITEDRILSSTALSTSLLSHLFSGSPLHSRLRSPPWLLSLSLKHVANTWT